MTRRRQLIGSAVTPGVRCTGSCHQQVVASEGLLAAEQTGAAGADAADGGQVGVMEDGQLHRQAPPHAEGRHVGGDQTGSVKHLNTGVIKGTVLSQEVI